MASRIRVYTEQMDERSDLVEMRTALANAKTIVFLGFGFHQQNMQIIDLNSEAARLNADVYATAFGESGPSVETIRDRIQRALMPALLTMGNTAGDDCAKFMQAYQPKLFG